jgi:hypothetical protein
MFAKKSVQQMTFQLIVMQEMFQFEVLARQNKEMMFPIILAVPHWFLRKISPQR